MSKRANHEGTVFPNKYKRGPGTAWKGEYKLAGIQVYGATKREAKQKLDERIELLGGVDGPDTVGALLDRFIGAGCPNPRRKNVRPSEGTLYRHEWCSEKLKAAKVGRRVLGSIHPGEVSVSDVEAALKYLYTATIPERNSNSRPTKPLGIESVKKTQDTLRMAFEFGRKRDWITRNVVKDALLPYDGTEDEEANPRGALTFKGAKKLADILEAEGLAFFYLLLGAGLRFGEAAALNVDDLSGSKLSVRKNVSRKFERPKGSTAPTKIGVEITENMKTPASRRTLVLSPEVVRVLKAHLRREAQRIKDERAEGKTPLMFMNSKGGILNDVTLRKQLAKLCRENGLYVVNFDREPLTGKDDAPRPPTLHELRHTAATLMIRQGKTALEVADYLGHKDTRTVFIYYRHPDFQEAKTGGAEADWLSR